MITNRRIVGKMEEKLTSDLSPRTSGIECRVIFGRSEDDVPKKKGIKHKSLTP
jgi:hypothetical protein